MEYQVLQLNDISAEKLQEVLDEQSKKNYELINFIKDQNNAFIAIFKTIK